MRRHHQLLNRLRLASQVASENRKARAEAKARIDDKKVVSQPSADNNDNILPAPASNPTSSSNVEMYCIKIQQNFDKKASLPVFNVWNRVIDKSTFIGATLWVSVKRKNFLFDRELASGFFPCVLNRRGYLVIYSDNSPTPSLGYAVNIRRAYKIAFKFGQQLAPPSPMVGQYTEATAAAAFFHRQNQFQPPQRTCKVVVQWHFGSVVLVLPEWRIAEWTRTIIEATNYNSNVLPMTTPAFARQNQTKQQSAGRQQEYQFEFGPEQPTPAAVNSSGTQTTEEEEPAEVEVQRQGTSIETDREDAADQQQTKKRLEDETGLLSSESTTSQKSVKPSPAFVTVNADEHVCEPPAQVNSSQNGAEHVEREIQSAVDIPSTKVENSDAAAHEPSICVPQEKDDGDGKPAAATDEQSTEEKEADDGDDVSTTLSVNSCMLSSTGEDELSSLSAHGWGEEESKPEEPKGWGEEESKPEEPKGWGEEESKPEEPKGWGEEESKPENVKQESGLPEQPVEDDLGPPAPLKRRVTFSNMRTIFEELRASPQGMAIAIKAAAAEEDDDDEEPGNPRCGKVFPVIRMLIDDEERKLLGEDKKEHISQQALDQMRIVGECAAAATAATSGTGSSVGADEDDDQYFSVVQQFPSQAERFDRTRRLFESSGDEDDDDDDQQQQQQQQNGPDWC